MNKEHVKRLTVALERRDPFFLNQESTNCFRLFSGSREGIDGFVADIYNQVLIIQLHEGLCKLTDDEVGGIIDWYFDKLRIRSAYVKQFVPDRSNMAAGPQLYSDVPFRGEKQPEAIVVLENGLSFEIRPYQGFSTGIFLDQRNHRAFLPQLSQEGKVLNCFSYTCAFSLACARQGASVTSVDLSRKYLDWGRRNFRLNGVADSGQKFICDDVLDYLRRLQRKKEFFDLVIVDPPNFSRNHRGKVFSVERDFKKLVEEVSKVVHPSGYLFLSSNYSAWTSATLKETVTRVLKNKKKRFESLPEAPLDFCLSDNPLSAVLLRLDD